MNIINSITGWFKAEPRKTGAGLVGLPEAYEQKQRFQFDFLIRAGLKPNHTFLDIGCGVLRGGLPVINYLDARRYVGVDLNAEAISIGIDQVRKKGLEDKHPSLIHVKGALSDCVLPFEVDIAWAFSVLIHMTDDHVQDCLRFTRSVLTPGGVFYANVNFGDAEDGVWREFPVKWRSFRYFEECAQREGLAVRDLGSLESFGHRSVSDRREDEQHMLEFKLA